MDLYYSLEAHGGAESAEVGALGGGVMGETGQTGQTGQTGRTGEMGERERQESFQDQEQEHRVLGQRSSSQSSMDSFQAPLDVAVETAGPQAGLEGIADLQVLDMPSGKHFEYHCQWNERDLFGKVNLYGLTLRYYEDCRTLIRFDGLVGEWVFSTLRGAYGPIDQYDLYIGAKITVFGRHLTISSASGSAMRWIEREKRRLEKHQEYFREMICNVGKVPCVRGKDATVIKHITRDKAPGQVDLRRLQSETARLGEQIASLGLAHQIR
ncbi:hypothetical protein B484DRAFT_433427 [Ochromonadaceae sp. CCMP2298]|nr:hypothetical protein B484DRAFT_433427 [Ochromonadaceae sp. CCMP2298]